MESSQVRQELEQLRKELLQRSYEYYVLDAPVISDYEYDMLYKKLEALEQAHPEWDDPLSPTKRVGGKALEK